MCFGRVFRRYFGGAIGNGFVRSFGYCFGDRGRGFWPASGIFLGAGLEYFFFKIGEKVDQKMDKIFVQNLATIFVQNLATGGWWIAPKCYIYIRKTQFLGGRKERGFWAGFLDKNLVHFLIQFWSRTASEKSRPRAPNVRQIAKYRVELGVGLSLPLRVVLGMDLEMDFGEVLEVGLGMFLECFCGVDLGLPLD